MTDKTLATFRIDAQIWEDFKTFCDRKKSNASSEITKFIYTQLGIMPINEASQVVYERLDNRIDELLPPDIYGYLDTRIDDYLSRQNIDNVIDTRIESCIDKLKKQ